jgi:hypothetical protein
MELPTLACGSNHPQVVRAAQEFPEKLYKVHGDRIRLRDTAVYFGNGSNPSSRSNGIDVHCSVCGHEWSPIANGLLQGQGCPECNRLKDINLAGKRRCPRPTPEEKARAMDLKATGMTRDAVAQQLFDEGLSPQLRHGKTIDCWTNPEQAEKARQLVAKRRQDPARREQDNTNSRRYYHEFEHGKEIHRASNSKRRALEWEALFPVFIDGEWYEVNMYDYLETPEDREMFVSNKDCVAYAALMKKCSQLEELLGEKFEVDHLVPLSVGGLHHEANFEIKGLKENRSKSDKRLEEDDALLCRRLFNIQ